MEGRNKSDFSPGCLTIGLSPTLARPVRFNRSVRRSVSLPNAIKRRFNCVLRRSLADQPPNHPVPKDKDIGGSIDMDSKMIFSTMFHLVLAKESWPLYSHHET